MGYPPAAANAEEQLNFVGEVKLLPEAKEARGELAGQVHQKRRANEEKIGSLPTRGDLSRGPPRREATLRDAPLQNSMNLSLGRGSLAMGEYRIYVAFSVSKY